MKMEMVHDEKIQKYNRHCKNEEDREKRHLSMELRFEEEWYFCLGCENELLKKHKAKHENSKKHLRDEKKLKELIRKLDIMPVERELVFLRRRLSS